MVEFYSELERGYWIYNLQQQQKRDFLSHLNRKLSGYVSRKIGRGGIAIALSFWNAALNATPVGRASCQNDSNLLPDQSLLGDRVRGSGRVAFQVSVALFVTGFVITVGAVGCSTPTSEPTATVVSSLPTNAPTSARTPGPTGEPTSTALREMLDRAQSDDAVSIDEVHFHSQARATVILNVEPNKLNVGGGEFRVKRNPEPPGGAFVYDPRTKFHDVDRKLVWWVPHGDSFSLTAYPLNSPSKMVTPGLEFPARAGVAMAPVTSSVVAYVFEGIPIPTATPRIQADVNLMFTVREYAIYRSLIDTPLSVSENEALVDIGKRYGISADQARAIVERVQLILSSNGWFGTAESEIRHASDWDP